MSKKKETPPTLTCEGCDAKCCRHVTVDIDKPSCKRDYDEVIWFLMHEDVSVFIDHDNDWNVEFQTKCNALVGELCAAYENRPRLCAEYDTETCVQHGEGPYYIEKWDEPEEFIAWLDGKGIDWRYKRRPSGRQRGVPLLQIKSA